MLHCTCMLNIKRAQISMQTHGASRKATLTVVCLSGSGAMGSGAQWITSSR